MPEDYKVSSTSSNRILISGDVCIQHIYATHVGIVFYDVWTVNVGIIFLTFVPGTSFVYRFRTSIVRHEGYCLGILSSNTDSIALRFNSKTLHSKTLHFARRFFLTKRNPSSDNFSINSIEVNCRHKSCVPHLLEMFHTILMTTSPSMPCLHLFLDKLQSHGGLESMQRASTI